MRSSQIQRLQTHKRWFLSRKPSLRNQVNLGRHEDLREQINRVQDMLDEHRTRTQEMGFSLETAER